ncbi:hypothetical protein M5K25_016867 [Dendrobium thyrsiflorum]|uniref:Uncharacterized protein n=1 Tax=Dendrobium thyrsiflorum TaxID=117978 RepID=A0ABD0UT14_DENTH
MNLFTIPSLSQVRSESTPFTTGRWSRRWIGTIGKSCPIAQKSGIDEKIERFTWIRGANLPGHQIAEYVDCREVFEAEHSVLELFHAAPLQLICVNDIAVVYPGFVFEGVEKVGKVLFDSFWNNSVGGNRFENQDGVMGDEGTAALAADNRMAHLLPVAGILDSTNHGGGVLVQPIAHGHVRAAGMGSIIVDAEAAPNVDHMHCSTKLGELTVDLSCLANAISKQGGGRNLGANHLQLLKFSCDREDLSGTQTKFSVLAGG